MKDLYKRSKLRPFEKDIEAIRKKITTNVQDRDDTQHVLLHQGRKQIYDRTFLTLNMIGHLRDDFDLTDSPHWDKREYSDFTARKNNANKWAAQTQTKKESWLPAVFVLFLIGLAIWAFIGDSWNPKNKNEGVDWGDYEPIGITSMYVYSEGLNVRAAPNGQAKKLGRLTQYDTIDTVDDKRSGDWVFFKYQGINAYAHSKYLLPGDGGLAKIDACRTAGVSRPRNGQILKASGQGEHTLEIKNQSGPDALVKLKNRSGFTVLSMYVHGGSTAKTNLVPNGTYQFQYATGSNYSPSCGMFLDDAQASKDPKFQTYEKTITAGGYYTQVMSYTLYRVSGGNFTPRKMPIEDF